MNAYNYTNKIMELIKSSNATFENILFIILQVEGYTSKQGKLKALEEIIIKELKNNSKKQVKDMLMKHYSYSKSGAYNLINKAIYSKKFEKK